MTGRKTIRNIGFGVIAIAVALMLMVCGTVRTYAMTRQEVLVQTADTEANSEVYVYAPTIYYMDSGKLIFGNGMGLAIYDFASSRIAGLVDLQAIDSGYYNSDTLATHVLVEDGRMIVYNTRAVPEDLAEDELGSAGSNDADAADDALDEDVDTDSPNSSRLEPLGSYYVFDISELEGNAKLLDYVESGDDEATIREYIARGGVGEAERYIDAWDNIEYLAEDDDKEEPQDLSYSENAYVANDENGNTSRNILICRQGDDEAYELLSESEGKEAVFTRIETGITEEMREEVREINQLPEFSYSGNDRVMAAILEYIVASSETSNADAGVAIPAPVIYGQVNDGDDILVFGNFWSDRYIRRGDTLVSISGAEMPACFHVSVNGDECEVTKAEMAGDGDDYDASIKAFTGDYTSIYRKFISDEGQNEGIRKTFVRSYAQDNELDIKYYKDYGWDPVNIYEN